jgi:outer membrane protein OmpA-like peptidoglycan-associated protein
MATIAYGESAPVADNRTRAGRVQNRRVVLVVLN